MKKKLLLLKFLFLLLISSYSFAQNCTVNANVDQNICANQTLNLVGNSGGLITTGPIWSKISGPSCIITSPSSLTTTVTGITPGTYVFRLQATCQDASLVNDNVTIIVRPITKALASIDQSSCPATLSLAGNAPGVNETGVWTVFGSNDAGVVINTPTSPTSTITLPNGNAGLSTLRWTITNSNGCISFDQMVVTNFGGVTPVNAGPDQTLSNCYTAFQSTTLSGTFGGAGLGGQIGTWTQVTGPNYATIGSTTSNLTSVGNLIQGTYTFRWSVSGPCGSGTDDVVINVPAGTQDVTQVVGTDVVFCSGLAATTAVLSGTVPTFSNETVTWTQLSGPPAVIANPNSSATVVSGLDGSSSYTFSYTLTNGVTGCASSDGGVSISYFSTPTAMTLPADEIRSCNDTTFSIPFVAGGGASNRFAIISGPFTQGFVGVSGNPQDVTLPQTGTYTLRFENYTDGLACASSFDDIQISVSLNPSASNAGTTQNLACNVTSTALAGNTPLVGIGAWSQVSGPNTAVIATPNTPASAVSGLISGVYVFRWIISTGPGCTPRSADVTIRVRTPLPPTNAGPDQNICAGSSTVLAASAAPASATGTWTVLPAGPVIANVNSPTTSVSGLTASTIYTFTWTVTNVCGSVNDAVVVTVSGTAGPTIANAGPDQCLPAGSTSATMAANTITIGTGIWAFVSGPGGSTVTTPSSPTTTITGLVNGTYIYTWSSSVVGCQTTRDSVRFTVNPTTSTSNAGLDQTICGTTAILAGNTPAIGIGTWTQTFGPGGATITTPSSPTSGITGLSPGFYRFNWTITNGACASVSRDTLVITVTAPPTTASAGPDQTNCSVTSATLAGNAPISGIGVWSLVGTAPNSPVFTNPNLNNTTVTGLVTGTYTFRWSITSGTNCPISTDDVVINVSAPANAGSDLTVCQQNAVQLIGTDGSTGTWTQIAGPASTITINSGYSATATITPNNNYTFRYTTNSVFGCPSTNDDISIVNSQYGTVPNAGPDQDLCLTSGSSITMAGNVIAVGTGTWTLAFGPNTPTITTPNSPTSTVTGLIQGLYIFNWNSANGNCSAFADVVRINVYNAPTVAAAGSDQLNACQTGFALAANQPVDGIGAWSQISGPTVAVFDFPSQPTSTVSNLGVGTYVFRWTITNGPTCLPSTDNVSITFPAATPTTPNAGVDQGICNVNTTNLTGNTITVGTGTWTLVTGPNVPTFTANNPTTSLNGLIAGTYRMLWTSSNGGCTFQDTVTIVNSGLPTTANAGPDDFYCPLETAIVLSGNTPTVGTGIWTQISGPTTTLFIDETLPNTAIAGTDFGTYVYQWSITNGFCPASNDNVQISFPTNCAPVIVDENITTPEDTPISGTVPGSGILNNGDSDSEGDLLSVTSVLDAPSNGVFIFDAAGNYTYTPNLNFNGLDTVVVNVCDNGSPVLCSPDTIFITVTPVNDPPVAIVNTTSTGEGIPVVIPNIDGNDTDLETFANDATIDLNLGSAGQQLTGTSTNGSWAVDTATGNVTYTPNPGFSGLDSLIYSICDNGSPLPTLCDTAYLIVSVFADTDGDGIADINDLDDDNDGLTDTEEVCGPGATTFACIGGIDPAQDNDGDGIPNSNDSDFCILYANGACTNLDTDGDGIPDNLDLDSDNDGILDLYESITDPAILNTLDPNGDGVVDGPYGTNGLADIAETSPGSGIPTVVLEDTDGDGVPNSVDLDSDNDGVFDVTEAGTGAIDANNDGIVDGTDTDGDGIINTPLTDTNATFGGNQGTLVDTDGDGVVNMLDLDADNDGIFDVTESGTGASDSNNDGIVDGTDTDGDGIINDSSIDVAGFGGDADLPNDAENDSIPNYLDIDSDNDGITDLLESGSGAPDTNNDGMVDGADTDGDGIVNDPTIDVAGFGGDNEDPVNTDNNGNPNYIDIDSDDDGIPDNLEGQPTGNYTSPSGVDADGNGRDDAYDTNPIKPEDTDGDNTPDYTDLDSDGDGIPDTLEAWDYNHDGVADETFSGSDEDGDGLDDGFENGTTGDGWDVNDAEDNGNTDTNNTDGEDQVDYRDLDSDNDGVIDEDEYNETLAGGGDDCDGDEIPNWYDIDVCDPWIPEGFSPDGDGINDFFVIPNIAYFPNNEIIIFNRWGNVVYQTKNYQNDWVGTTNVNLTVGGEELPTGTYYYVFTAQNDEYEGILNTVKKGYVYIQR